MADVRGFVGINTCVLDERVDVGVDRLGIFTAGHQADSDGAIEVRVDVSGSGDLEGRKPARRAEFSHDLLGDDLGCFAQLARQFEGYRSCEFAKLEVGWSLERYVLDDQVVLRFEHVAQMRLEPILEFLIHAVMPRKLLIIKLILPDQILDATRRANLGNATKGTRLGIVSREGSIPDALFCLTPELVPGFILLA